MTSERSAHESPSPDDIDFMVQYPKGDPPAHLWHYTNQSGLFGILNTKQLWATNLRFLNDDQEYIYAKRLALEELDALSKIEAGEVQTYLSVVRNIVADLGTNLRAGVFALSEVEDDLGQWRGYGTGVGAYALVFNGPEVNARFPHAPPVRCEYEPEEQRLLVRRWLKIVKEIARLAVQQGVETLREVDQYVLLAEHFSRMAPALKHPGFRAEKEWRMIALPLSTSGMVEDVRSTPTGLRPLVKIPLGDHLGPCLLKVVVGPMPDQRREIAAVERLLEMHKLTSVAVMPSEVPFRTW